MMKKNKIKLINIIGLIYFIMVNTIICILAIKFNVLDIKFILCLIGINIFCLIAFGVTEDEINTKNELNIKNKIDN